MVRATVLIPTHDHGPTLRRSVASALSQTIRDLEILLVGDGMPPDAAAVAREVAAGDARVRLFEFGKGPRHGEIYRHKLLTEEARGEVICYLSDDDLYLPDHVERMLVLLEKADLAHALPLQLMPDGRAVPWVCDLSLPYFRNLLLSGTNRVPFGTIAHTMRAYHALPHGWRTTPAGEHTDLCMLQQFLRQPKLRAVSGMMPTVLHMPSSTRKGWTPEQRLAELDRWSSKLADPAFPAAMHAELVAWFARHATTDEAHYCTLEDLLRSQLEQTSGYAAGLETMLAGIGIDVRS